MRSFTRLAAGIAAIAATIGMVRAQSISTQCESALAGVLTDSGAACLNPTGLIPILQAGNDTSLIAPLNTWDQAMCKSSLCTNATLASVTSDITSGCQTELGSLGLGNISSAELTTIVQQLYPSVREILCSQDTSNNTLCPTEFLTNLQSVTGTFTLASAETFLNQVVSSGVPNIPKSVECTDCTKQWYNIIKAAFPDVVSSDAESNISGTCGADFVNGQTPSDVAAFGTSGNSSTSGDTSGAASTHVDARLAFVAVAVLSPLVALL